MIYIIREIAVLQIRDICNLRITLFRYNNNARQLTFDLNKLHTTHV